MIEREGVLPGYLRFGREVHHNMLHWRVMATFLAVVVLAAFASLGGAFHWGALRAVKL
jgi:hypothetical protein